MATIERTEPIKIHKNLLIEALRNHPDDLDYFVSGFDTAAQAITWLEARPEQWLNEIEENVRREREGGQ